MNKICLRFIVAAVTFTAVASCVQEAQKDNHKGLENISITASTEGHQAKASLSEAEYPAIIWNSGDAISVIGKNTGNQKFVTSSEGKTATFNGLASISDETLYAVYPYDAAVALSTSKNVDADLLNVTIPTTQAVTDGSFDPKAFVVVGKSTDRHFSFKTVGSFFKFRLNEGSKVKSVRIEANKGEEEVILSGTAAIALGDNGLPSHGIKWGTTSSFVILKEQFGSDRFADDKDYFIVTRAEQCPYGITVYITYDDGRIYRRSTSKQIFPEDPRNCIMNLGVLDTGGEWLTVLDEVVDFSYAGYHHGEEAPAEVNTLGYKVYDVTNYGAIPNDGKSDRKAFLDVLEKIFGKSETDNNGWCVFPHRQSANAIVYFPEGEYILYSKEDDVNGKSPSIVIRGGNFVLKGAGKDKTVLVMSDPMSPANASSLYSSPDMIQLKHNSGLSTLTSVKGSKAMKGSFSVQVENAASVSVGDWVCLYILDASEKLVNQEIAPYSREDGKFFLNGKETSWKILTQGVEVYDYHKVKSIDGNVVTFYEPLMHEVDPQYKWEIKKFPHYENVGVEDIAFRGNAPENYRHHGSWQEDGGYKPLSMMRLTDSWIRRVRFESTSECCSVINSANVSVYDILMEGNRGHAAIRSQDASRVLIAATEDVTSDGAGNFHGVGVSKHTMGTVLWRNAWGYDSCFESHANQPRATLIDCCRGGLHQGHMGGDANEGPHHLADLTIWNFYATAGSGQFSWWDTGSWRFLPPIIVGFQSANNMTFDPSEIRYDESHGQAMIPESLYEYQLEQRLGRVPQWINDLKSIN